MSSSTSSSEPRPARRRRVWPVMAVVLALLAGLELASRRLLVPASRDLHRFRGYAAGARELEAAPGFRLALVGNSATDRGVEPALLRGRLEAALGQPLEARKFVADASRINDWYHILNHYFWRPGVRADLFVITFYENDIEDGNAIEVGRLAQFFTNAGDWRTVMDVDLPRLGDRLEFALGSAWATFALRARIRERVLGLVVPGYKPFVTGMNAAHFAHLRRRARQGDDEAPAGYRALDRLLAAARAHGSRLVFVAYPTPPGAGPPYPVRPEGLRKIAEAGMSFIDMRGRVPELQARHYADDVHLTPEGATIYSDRLAEALRPTIGALEPHRVHAAAP